MSIVKHMLVFMLFVSGLIGCERRKQAKPLEKEELAWTPTYPINNMYALRDSALKTGDERVYSQVAAYYLMRGNEQEFLYCALTMANKYNCAMAYFHVFLIIKVSGKLGYSDPTFKGIDNKSKDFALYNLLRSYELDPKEAKYAVAEIFGKNKPIPKSSTYLQKYLKD